MAHRIIQTFELMVSVDTSGEPPLDAPEVAEALQEVLERKGVEVLRLGYGEFQRFQDAVR